MQQSRTNIQESPRFSLQGRYSTDFLVHHSWLIDIICSHKEWGSSLVRGPSPLIDTTSLRSPGAPTKNKIHHYTKGLHQSYPPPSVIPKYSIPPMQGTTHKVVNDRCGNIKDYGSRISRVNQHSHLTIQTSSNNK